MRLAIIRLPATPLVDTQLVDSFGGADVRAFTFARTLANRSRHQISLVVRRRRHDFLPPSDTLRIVPIVDRPRSSDRNWNSRLAWELPRDVACNVWNSVRRSHTDEPSTHREFRRLEADVLASFGLHSPTCEVVRSAHADGRPAVVLLTSDEEVRRAIDIADGPRRLQRLHRRYRYAIETADLVVAQTEFQRHAVQRLARQVVLIRNPIDIAVEDHLPSPMLERRHVLWMGRADVDCKRADLGIAVARQCPNVAFVMVMNATTSDVTKKLRATVPSNVRLIEQVPWSHSDALFENALALLNTSDHEGFPNAFLQAAKFGVPILSRRVDPDDCLKRGLGFVANDCLSTLIAMVQRLHRDPQRYEAVSAAARSYVVAKHDSNARAADLMLSIENLLATRDTTRAA